MLDENGGPNHVGNFCFAPIHANTKADKIIYTPSYYYIGHFSKFIRQGAKRISAASSRSQLLCTAFKNVNGKIAIVVMNQSDEEIDYNMVIGDKAAVVNIPPHAIQTLIL